MAAMEEGDEVILGLCVPLDVANSTEPLSRLVAGEPSFTQVEVGSLESLGELLTLCTQMLLQ